MFLFHTIVNNQVNTNVLLCKSNKNNSTDQANSLFSDVFNTEKPVKISFTAPELSNPGGLALVSKVAKDSRLIGKFASLIPEWRNEFTLVHTIPQLVCQRVMQIAAGFEDADDCDALRDDSILKMCVGRNRMSCHKFTANQFRLYLSGLAYILLEDVRHKMSRKSSLKSSTLITLRNKIILSPVKVTEQKTQIKVEFQPDHPRRGWLRWNLMTA